MTAISAAKSLHAQLLTFSSIDKKIAFLEAESKKTLPAFLQALPAEKKFLFLLLQALHQEHLLAEKAKTPEQIEKLSDLLLALECFYRPIGGLLGYHIMVLELMQREHNPVANAIDASDFLPPPIFDLRVPSNDLLECIRAGIMELPKMGELYPVGGAGDRMNLLDDKEGRPLPVACLKFLGKTLLELLVRDLEAREYLYYKLFQQRIITPIALMTSEEKMNDQEIEAILEKNNWFNRGRHNFFRFVQPPVPVITLDGKWAAVEPFEPICKPGGHGVIWKLAIDSGAFDWLQNMGREALIVRQINNPLAGLNMNLLAHFGYGRRFKRAFGFLSCPRKPGAQEGMNVLKVANEKSCITNIEYTEFAKLSHVEMRDAYPANTNILFADLQKIREGVTRIPIPGTIINMKSSFRDSSGKEIPGARLESTMQNIGEAFDDTSTFLLLNDRAKTISVAKKSYDGKGSKEGTPEGAYEDLMKANRELLEQECGLQVVGALSPHFIYSPKLGPLYSIIRQKIHHGTIHEASELQIEAQEVSITHLDLSGSLLIQAGEEGRCLLNHVKVQNRGIDRDASNCYWKNEIRRKEVLKITLEGNSAFFAENIEFNGSQDITIPNGMQGVARKGAGGQVEIRLEPLTQDWHWSYSFNSNGEIVLSKTQKVTR